MVNRERDEQRESAQEPRGEQRRIPRKQRRTAAGSGFLGECHGILWLVIGHLLLLDVSPAEENHKPHHRYRGRYLYNLPHRACVITEWVITAPWTSLGVQAREARRRLVGPLPLKKKITSHQKNHPALTCRPLRYLPPPC